MAENNNKDNSAAKPADGASWQPLMDFWTDCIEANNEQVKVLLDSMSGQADLGTLRQRWLESLASSFDSYMRTPAFLEGMRKQFEAVTAVKSTAEDLVQEFSRDTGVPRIQDISGLFERLKTTQDLILARLGAIEQRLGALEEKTVEKK